MMTNQIVSENADYSQCSNGTTGSSRIKYNKSLKTVFVITAAYLIVEVVLGFVSNSLALLSDAANMFTDAGGQALALFAIFMSARPRNIVKTFSDSGKNITALINAVLLTDLWIYLYEAFQRFRQPETGRRIQYTGFLTVK